MSILLPPPTIICPSPSPPPSPWLLGQSICIYIFLPRLVIKAQLVVGQGSHPVMTGGIELCTSENISKKVIICSHLKGAIIQTVFTFFSDHPFEG